MRIHLTDGDGNNPTTPTSGFTRYITRVEFEQYCKSSEKDRNKINVALWGPDGRSGIVAAVNEINTQVKIILALVAFVQPILLALIFRWLGL